jgi:Zn-dependent protease with chaperone function
VIPALALLAYAACAAWLVPALLTPLTGRGLSVRAGLAAWLAAMGSVLASAALAVQFSLRTVAADWPQLTQTLCRSVAGAACTPAVYRSFLYQAAMAALALLLTLAAAVAAVRYGRRVRRSRAQTRSHARTALLVGRALAGFSLGARTVVLDDPRPAAYCAAGRPAAIVVTSGALAVLDPPQLRAVLAHERAHLAGRHHVLVTVVRGLAAAFPAVPLFSRGAAEVDRLAEMSADDTAARSAGRRTVAAALLALATGSPVPGTARPARLPATHLPATYLPATHLPATYLPATYLPATHLPAAAHAVPARVDRLLAPSATAAAARAAALLAALTTLLVLVPPLLAGLLG